VDALVAQRTSGFQSQLASAVARDTQLLRTGAGGREAAELSRRLAVLRSLQGQPDPTLRRAATATAPRSASSPTPWVLVLVGAGSGLAAGLVLSTLLAVARRRRPFYDRPVAPGSSDRAVEALVERLEQRLAARESALAARERDLQARIDELRMLEARAASPDTASPDTAPLAERERALAERERNLEERVATVTKRELALARAAARSAPQPAQQAPPPAKPPASVRAADPAAGGGFNLSVLERLVAERGGSHPERLDEWSSYLFFLRDYAGADGNLPPSFDALVEETFRPLLT
jgi:hypothetical protein